MSCVGIDVGSSNVKVALCDGDLDLVEVVTAPLVTERSGTAATQNASALWAAVLGALGRIVATHPAEAGAVTSIGVCGQYSSIIPVGADLAPVGPMITYLDPRGTEASWAIAERHPGAFARWIELHGIPPVGSGLSLGHILWCESRPELAAATSWYLEPVDYVVARLTGTVAATQGTVFTSQLCDNRTLDATTYHGDLVTIAGVDPDRLPPLVAPDAVVGVLEPDVATATGLGDGVEVRAGLNDSQAGALATGALRPGRGGLAIGTTSVLFDAVGAKAEDLDHEVVTMPGPLADRWLVWAENGLAGRSVEAVLDWLTPTGTAPGTAPGAAFAELEPALATSPPGANGVVFGPQLSGSMSPVADSAMRGSFLGLSLDTTRADLIRAAVEGTAINLVWLLDVVEGFTGQPLDELTFAGGAARSPGWAQCIADACGRPLTVLDRPEAAVARAAAAWGALGVDAEAVLATGAAGAAPPTPAGTASGSLRRRFVPDEAAGEALGEGREVFLAAFDALRPIYNSVAHPSVDQEP